MPSPVAHARNGSGGLIPDPWSTDDRSVRIRLLTDAINPDGMTMIPSGLDERSDQYRPSPTLAFSIDEIDFDGIDTRMIAYPGPTKSVSVAEASVKGVFFASIMAIALVGNILVIATVVRCKRMHKTTYYYLVNLAISDLAITLSCSWVYLVDDLTEGWVLGAFFCKINSFVQVLSLVSSILTLMLIACDRFFGIVFALKARLTERRSSTFIIVVWIVSFIISAPLLFYRGQFTRQWLNHAEVWCGDSWPYDERIDATSNRTIIVFETRTIYYTTVSLVLYFIPMVVVSLAYTAIVWKLWSSRPPGELVETTVSGQSTRLRNNKKVIQMLVVVLTVFGLCWLPFQISILYPEFRHNPQLPLPAWYHDFQYFATFLAYANSAFNPIIYTCFNDTFRKGFIDAFRAHHSRGYSTGNAGFDERSRYNNTNTVELRLDVVEQTRYNSTARL